MSTTTTQTPATGSNATGVQSAQTALPTEDQSASAFESLWDRGAFAPTDEKGQTLSPEDQRRLEAEAQGQQAQQEGQQEQTEQPSDDKGQQQTEGESEDYESLDAYLTKQQLDKEAFLSLPVTVKVDGAEQSVPLAEVVKGYQLAQASYNRMNELAQARNSFTTEQTQVRHALGVRIQQIEGLLKSAQDQLMGDYAQITPQQWQQLRAENPGEYAALTTQFQQRQQALQQQLQQIAQAKQEEARQAQLASQQALPQERERLLQARPEWRDAAKFQAARDEIVKAGRQLGFTDAELGGITDHRHLIVLDLAARALKNQASQPGVLKRVRAAPRMAAPGTRVARDPKRESINTANEAWKKSGYRDDAAAAAVFSNFV